VSYPASLNSEAESWEDLGKASEVPEKEAQNIRSPRNVAAEPVPKALSPLPSKKRAFEVPLDERMFSSPVIPRQDVPF